MAAPETRSITLVDLPLLWRLGDNGIILDSEVGLTRDARSANSSLISSILFPRGVYTLVARSDAQRVVGQFRYRQDDLTAHLVYLAPSLPDNADDTLWLQILDGVAREAGKHGAHSLLAEVAPNSRLFETLRMARFATYARQTIWRHAPVAHHETTITLTEENSGDQIGIMSLIGSTVPAMLHQVAAPPSDLRGLVYRKNGLLEAYIAVSEGEQGVYLLPYVHPDVLDRRIQDFAGLIQQTTRAHKVPVYICVRSFQCWLDPMLEKLGFEPWLDQVLMVKHIAAGIRHPNFGRLQFKGKLAETSQGVMPPSWLCTGTDHLRNEPERYGTTDYR